LDQNKIVINNVFEFKVVFGITKSNDEIESQTIEEYRYQNDRHCKEVIQTKLNSLANHEVFGHVVYTPKGVIHVGYKWVFIKNQNENNEII
jgi:hypothetical protein